MGKKFSLFLLILMLLFPMKIFADGVILEVDGESFTESGISTNGSVVYNSDDNTLTLNNYDGGVISYYGNKNLTIILNGKSTITSDYYTDGIASSAGLIFTGNGSLLMQDVSNGISISSGDLVINDTNISINNISRNGIFLWDGNVTINGNLSMDDDLIKKEQEMGYVPHYQAINIEGGDITINGNVSINNAKSAFLTDKSVIIKSGKSIIKTFNTAINTVTGFNMAAGDLDIELMESEDNYFLNYGIVSEGEINIIGGKLHVKVPDNSIAIAAINYDLNDPLLNIASDLVVIPNNYSIQTILIDDYYEFKAKLIGHETLPVIVSSDYGSIVENSINDVTIRKYTYDIIDGDNQKFIVNKINKYEFTIDGDFNLFKRLYVDNTELEKDIDYLVSEGSTVIEFTDSGIKKLNLLAVGIHNISIEYDGDKTVINKLTILANNPKTGDSIYYNLINVLLSMIGIIIISKKIIK